jgi:hypothetical protein
MQAGSSVHLPPITVFIPCCSAKNTFRVGMIGVPLQVAKTALATDTNIAAGEILHGRAAD